MTYKTGDTVTITVEENGTVQTRDAIVVVAKDDHYTVDIIGGDIATIPADRIIK